MAAPPLERLDPAREWQPWEPAAAAWDRKWAGHLYRRAAFGASPGVLRQAVRRGLPATLDLLLKGEPGSADLLDFLAGEGAKVARRSVPSQLRAWWVYCMLNSGHPLREKMTLFWHNHFATSNSKVNSTTLMAGQNNLLRRHALGKFEPFVQAVSKDPAMLVWLDSNSNVKGAANENYARELMELFTLGVGNYTEKDIREAARAFTGWHTDGDAFEFNRRQHDDGAKTVFGQTGKWNGDDVVRVVLKQPAAARFLVRKLYSFLVSEAEDVPAALLEPLAERFRKSGYDISDLVRTMLASRHFFSAHAFRRRVKGPVEFVLGAVLATVDGTISPQALVGHIDAMGQELFAPPNVKGWRGGKAWLTTSTMLARQNFAQQLAMGQLWGMFRPLRGGRLVVKEAPPEKPGGPPEELPPAKSYDVARLVHAEKAAKPEDAVRVLLDVYVPGGVRDAARTRLTTFLAEGSPGGEAFDRRVREAAHAILAMPEAQLA
jgi:hypothetical protein